MPAREIPLAVAAELDASKVDTHNDKRDGDLRSEHFFNVATWPTITFVSTKVEGTDPKHFTISGNLTMHGQTHPVVLNASVVGAKSPRGRSIIRLEQPGNHRSHAVGNDLRTDDRRKQRRLVDRRRSRCATMISRATA